MINFSPTHNPAAKDGNRKYKDFGQKQELEEYIQNTDMLLI